MTAPQLGSCASSGRRPTGRPATAYGARASRLQTPRISAPLPTQAPHNHYVSSLLRRVVAAEGWEAPARYGRLLNVAFVEQRRAEIAAFEHVNGTLQLLRPHLRLQLRPHLALQLHPHLAAQLPRTSHPSRSRPLRASPPACSRAYHPPGVLPRRARLPDVMGPGHTVLLLPDV
eukprot:scaffold58033_cov63-Phaeocystis_antarctica.AAC.2